jgi:transposase
MQIIRAIVSGERDAKILAKYRDRRCKKKEDEIAKALEGNYRPELIFALKQSLEAYDFFQTQILACEEKIEKILEDWKASSEELIQSESRQKETTIAPEKKKTKKGGQKKTAFNRSPYYFDAAEYLKQILGIDVTDIPGVDGNTAIKILSEIGTDMSHWPTSKHFASWLALCPGNKISGGKVLSSKTKTSANRAAYALRLAANAIHKSQTALGAFFRRMRSRLGAPEAITAAAHKIAVILYNMIKDRKAFHEFGEGEYERRHKERIVKNLRRKAVELGYTLVEAVPEV